jgi:hypothetical protein
VGILSKWIKIVARYGLTEAWLLISARFAFPIGRKKKMQEIIEYKHDNLKQEFASKSLSKRLLIIVYALAGYVYCTFGKSITLTDIFRTQEVQDEYRKLHPEEPEFSPHTYWRAVDISIKYFTHLEIGNILLFLEQFQYGDDIHETAILHDVIGSHIHIQVSRNNFTKVVEI